MKRFAHPILLGCMVEGLLGWLLFLEAKGGILGTAVLVLHFPGLLISSFLNLGNGDEVLPTVAIMLGVWVLFFYRLRAHLRGPDRQKPVTSNGLRIIAIITVVGVGAVLLIQRYGPRPRQDRNLAMAEGHIQVLRPILQQDPRFTNVTLYPFTGLGGVLSVSGELVSERDLSDLKQLVASSKPPVEVVYYISVVPPDLLELLKTNAVTTSK